jgi:hypothetical protein
MVIAIIIIIVVIVIICRTIVVMQTAVAARVSRACMASPLLRRRQTATSEAPRPLAFVCNVSALVSDKSAHRISELANIVTIDYIVNYIVTIN